MCVIVLVCLFREAVGAVCMAGIWAAVVTEGACECGTGSMMLNSLAAQEGYEKALYRTHAMPFTRS